MNSHAFPTSAPSEADPRLAELVDELTARLKAGETPDFDLIQQQYPEHAAELQGLLPAMRLLADLSNSASRDHEAVAVATGLGEAVAGLLGDFRIVREIGRGGMAVVYEAEQMSLERRVALKVLPLASTMDGRRLQRFHIEAKAAACLHHTNIVPVFAVGCERGVHFYAMQFIDGMTLAAVIHDRQTPPKETTRDQRGGPVTTPYRPGIASTAAGAALSTAKPGGDAAYFRKVAELGAQTAEALDYAHQMGVVHRDIKPGNLMLDGHGTIWVTDFGLALLQTDTGMTMTGDLLGTLRYMSPEQALAKRVPIDHRTDVYSLGATLYELLTLRPVFAGDDRQELLRQIAFEEPAGPRRLNRAIPRELETIVLKALEKKPQERYATAQELANDLHRFLEDKPIQARRPSWKQVATKWALRHKAVVWAAAVVLLVTGLLGGGTGLSRLEQRAAGAREAEVALRDADRLQTEGKLPEAMWAIRRAEPLRTAGLLNDDLARRVGERQRDLEMLDRLEDVRLQKAGVKDGHFDIAAADPAYGLAFRNYGIDVPTLGPGEAAKRIEATGIAKELAEALQDWALVCKKMRSSDDRTWQHLLAVARAADPDEARNRLRDALENKQSRAELVASAQAEELSTSTVALLGRVLWENDARQEAVGLLRRVQHQHPGDFWVNHELAYYLTKLQPPQWDEAGRFYTAALAVRPHSPGARLNLGEALRGQGRLEEAKAEYRKAIELKPDYADAYSGLGIALGVQGKQAEAVAACHKVIELKPDSPWGYLQLGNALGDQGKLAEAVDACRKAVELKPDFREAYNNLGVALKKQGKLVEAEAAYRKAIELKPDYANAYANLAIALGDQGKQAEAVFACRKAIELKPDLPEAYKTLGTALGDQGKQAEAVEACRKAIELKPDYAAAYDTLGNVLREQGKLAEAVVAGRKAIELKPDFAGAYSNLGTTLWEQGKQAEAVDACRKAIELKPDFREAYNNLGLALKKQGKLVEAEAAYRKAIELKPDFAEAYANLGDGLYQQGKRAEAEAAFHKAVALKPDFAAAYISLGFALCEQGKLADGVAAYCKAIELKPDYAEAYSQLGNVLREQGKLAEAVDACRKAIELKSDYAEPYNNLGNALGDQGKRVEAVAVYRKAIELKPDYSKAHYNLAIVLHQQGKLAEAEAANRKAIELKPDYAEAYLQLGNALCDQGKLAEAEATYRKAIELKPGFAYAHCNLGEVLKQQGQFADALAESKRGHELNSRNPASHYPSAQLLLEAERRVKLDAKLPAVLNGQAKPANGAECVELAEICRIKQLYAGSVRFFQESFATDPKQADDMQLGHRYDAACAAALAGCGQGKDAVDLDIKERARLHRQARDWLRADLTACGKQLEMTPDKMAPVVTQQMQHWLADADFNGVRGDDVAKLPEEEREPWRQLWADVAATLKKALEKTAPEEKPQKSP